MWDEVWDYSFLRFITYCYLWRNPNILARLGLRWRAQRRLGVGVDEVGMGTRLRENGSGVVQRDHDASTAARPAGAPARKGGR